MANFDIYEVITSRIVGELEQGRIPWEKPWTGGKGAWSRATGKPYSFLNQLLLPHGEYVTLKELVKEGGDASSENLKDKSHWVIFWKFNHKVEKDDNGEDVERTYPVLRYFKVFNVKDVGLEQKYYKDEPAPEIEPCDELERIKDDYISRANVSFDESESNEAFYVPLAHRVHLPLKSQFSEVAEYYNTLFHELAHSTGHSSLLNRLDGKVVLFGSEDYSREELVAELTACAIVNNAGLETHSSFRNNAAYIQSWLKALKDDKRMLVWASSRANEAYDLIMNGQVG